MDKILLIHGPNLNLLGKRNINIYGKFTEDDIINFLKTNFPNIKFDFFQSNSEGAIIDIIHTSFKYDGIIINPGAFAHYSYSIRDAIESIEKPFIEVHISNTNKREDFRKKLVLSDVCVSTIIGKAIMGYKQAVNHLKELV